jgi:hypothetical protein
LEIRNSGDGLIVVIWVLTFFGIVLSAFAFSMRTEPTRWTFMEEAEAVCPAGQGRWAVARWLIPKPRVGVAGLASSFGPGFCWVGTFRRGDGRGEQDLS